MLTLAILAVTLTSGTACSPLSVSQPVGNYITPGVLGDLPYHDGLTLDAYAPEGEPHPSAVIIHGSYGDKRTHLTQLFEPLRRAGFAWFSVDYRNREDVETAIQFIRCPGRFNISSVMFLIGEDTGGEMALELAAAGGFQGVATFGVKLSEQFAAGILANKDKTRRVLPAVPVHMFHGTKDDESPSVRAQAICKEMSSCVFHAVAGGTHQLENWHPDEWAWKEDLTAWLRGSRRGLWKDIVYARPAGRDLLMDGYIPEGNGPFPAAIIVHGGGWEAGDKVTYVSPIFEPLARSRIAWFSMDYRLTPYVHVPDQLEDVRSAIRFVRQHAERFHIDPKRVALIGESASGHLVAQVVSEPCPDCEAQAAVSFYGVYDLTNWSHGEEWQRQTLERILGDVPAETAARYSPIEHVTTSLPPMLLIQGTEDELYKGTLEYAARLRKTGAHFELVLLEGAPHGMENWEGHPEWAFYKQRLVQWLWSIFESR
jgi:acetyl esterase